jgi:hypothetical protein
MISNTKIVQSPCNQSYARNKVFALGVLLAYIRNEEKISYCNTNTYMHLYQLLLTGTESNYIFKLNRILKIS